MSCSTTLSMVASGMAKLMPDDCPSLVLVPCLERAVAMATFMPMTRPRASTNGPPELPGFTAASVWM